MSTRGFIGIRANGKNFLTYNHSDSYPTWLGIRAVEFVVENDLDALGPDIAELEEVDENEKPTPLQMADLKRRGYWQDVSEGDDWYAALRSAQGDLLAYIEAGYIITITQDPITAVDTWLEWGYVIDVDQKVIEVYEMGETGEPMVLRTTMAFDTIKAPGFDAKEHMIQIEHG